MDDMLSKNASQLSRPVITSLLKWRFSLPVPYIVNRNLWHSQKGIFINMISKWLKCSILALVLGLTFRIALQSSILPMLVVIQKADCLDPTSNAFQHHHAYPPPSSQCVHILAGRTNAQTWYSLNSIFNVITRVLMNHLQYVRT